MPETFVKTKYIIIILNSSSFTNYSKQILLAGYFGGCNEEEMKLALVKGGPLVVGLEVYNDFLHYKGGVYRHTGLMDRFNPLEVSWKLSGRMVRILLFVVQPIIVEILSINFHQ